MPPKQQVNILKKINSYNFIATYDESIEKIV